MISHIFFKKKQFFIFFKFIIILYLVKNYIIDNVFYHLNRYSINAKFILIIKIKFSITRIINLKIKLMVEN